MNDRDIAGESFENCGFCYTLSLISGKYKMVVLYTLANFGVVRFNEMKKYIGGVSDKTLSATLKELEADGLVTRTVFAQVPPRVEYALTDRGKELWPILHRLAHWAENEPFDGDESQAE